MAAAGAIRTPFRAATYQVLIGLLAATGMRVGEAISLDNGDLDAGQGLLTIESVRKIVPGGDRNQCFRRSHGLT